MQTQAGRRWAYVVMLLMLSLSIAGNVSHTLHITPDPSVRSLVYAVMWPVMVWLGVELFVRVPWQPIFTHRMVRWVGILLVAFIAGLVSYRHLRGLLLADSEDWIVSTFGPLAIDGLMFMATLALLLTRPLPAVPALFSQPEMSDAELEQTVSKRSAQLAAPQYVPTAEELEHAERMAAPELEQRDTRPAAERAPRAGKPEQEKAVRLMLDGQRSIAVADGLLGDSTMRRYERVARILRDDPAARVDARVEKVRPELVEIIRYHMNLERGR